MSAPKPPEGMALVTKDAFYAALKADPRDIMPSTHEHATEWLTRERAVWGWTYPGWKNPGEERLYALHSAAKDGAA